MRRHRQSPHWRNFGSSSGRWPMRRWIDAIWACANLRRSITALRSVSSFRTRRTKMSSARTLRRERAELIFEADRLVTNAVSAGKPLTAEQRTQLDGWLEQAATMMAEIQTIEAEQ